MLTQGSYLSCRDKAADSWSSQNKIEKFRESRANLPESIETWLHRLVFPCWQFLCHMAVNMTPKQGTKGRQWTMADQLSWLGHSWWHVAIVHFFERHNIFMTSYKTNRYGWWTLVFVERSRGLVQHGIQWQTYWNALLLPHCGFRWKGHLCYRTSISQ